jgi:hypothetical protein
MLVVMWILEVPTYEHGIYIHAHEFIYDGNGDQHILNRMSL